MILSYAITDNLKGYLKTIHDLRVKILIYPLPVNDEIILRWKTAEARGDKEIFDYIKQNWYVTAKNIDIVTVKKVYELVSEKRFGPTSGMIEFTEKKLNEFLKYFESSNDHPVIQAALIQAEIINLNPFGDVSEKVARMMSYFMLYKYGYDIRGLVNIEDFYNADLVTYRKFLRMSQNNRTAFLEYFAYALMKSLEKKYDETKKMTDNINSFHDFWRLSVRQQKILELFEEPNKRLRNKEIQKIFKISQVTASRDMARLYKLGLLLAHGKGRGVFYTKA
ncbi:MAG TPA: HTH domain-containing protein [Patescibacteria group bacterium]|nr:HTH domain-containing protein [Patescibacteria group bacterium]